MAVFMEESSVNGRNRYLWLGAGLPVLTRRFPSSQGPFSHLQFLGPETHNSLTEQRWLANDCNIHLPRNVIDNFIKSEGDTGI